MDDEYLEDDDDDVDMGYPCLAVRLAPAFDVICGLNDCWDDPCLGLFIADLPCCDNDDVDGDDRCCCCEETL